MPAAVTVLLAATLILAAIAKIRDPEPFRESLRIALPDRSARGIAATLPIVELVLAAALVAAPAGTAGRIAALLVLGLLLAFTAALLWLERRAASRRDGMLLRCNCFGSGGDGDPATGRVRNLLLAVGAAALVAAPAGPLWRVDAGELAGAACVAIGLTCVWQLAVALRRLRTVGLPS
ncbi:MauE/DoxX family redox-associated membrane protein [Patulibacter defluvii]|uniref:MauE/DoxX family redox-associated membrane protein n=1 Tax=Patulibacter defluvii TaxID=3095358 RepID=UPI002A766814|nr:MauE/DoxX family redox-associated membrane protein [Patulibacter sp. DM4]